MAESKNATTDILKQVLDEYGGRISIDGGSKILVSDAYIASSIFTTTEAVRTPYGPTITVAAQRPSDEEASKTKEIPNANVELADKLQMDHYSHAVFGLSAEDPKYVLEGLRHMIYAMQPKAISIVIQIKQESGEERDGQFTVDLVDKMKYQSKGKVNSLSDVLEYAGFERGKIRSFEKTSEVGGQKVEAEVVLAMKWDQLNA